MESNNQQLNCNKMIKEIKVTSQRSPISDILHVFLENIFPRKHHLGIERPWAEWKKSLWKAISISPTSLHRILTSCQNWKQSFILHQWKEGNILWEQDKVFPARLFLFIEKMVVTSPPLRKNKCSYEYIALQCLYKTSINFLKSIYIVYH